MIMLLFCLLVCLSVVIQGFNLKTVLIKTKTVLFAQPGSYVAKLEQAKLAKLNKNNDNIINRPTSSSNQQNIIKEQSVIQKSVQQISIAKQIEQPKIKDELPFTFEIYSHLKYVISTIASRMKSTKPLTEEEFELFLKSTESIISDALNPSIKSISNQQIINYQKPLVPLIQSTSNQVNKQSNQSNISIKNTQQNHNNIVDDRVENFDGFNGWNVPG